jgi:polyribonucleotide nucleotidyltransferase
MSVYRAESVIGDVSVVLETGRFAKQADGAVVVRIGDTMVLVTACGGNVREGVDFFPLTVEYIAKTYAAGKIPGGFFKREGKPSEKEVLSARLVDRPLRPLFPKGYHNEVQIIATVISADDKYDADVMAITGASCALMLSSLPFTEPVAGVRVGMVDGKLKVFPTLEETGKSPIDLIVAGTEQSIMMVEGGAWEVKEEAVIEAIQLAHAEIKKIVGLQRNILAQAGSQKQPFTEPVSDPAVKQAVSDLVKDRIHEISFCGDKKKRYAGIKALAAEVQKALAERFPERTKEIAEALNDIEVEDMRSTILEKGVRIGGRGLDTIRNITCELDVLPRAHGSALFTRGETQAMVVATLGTKVDEQKIDGLQMEYNKSYMLHYNFPPFSVGEVKRVGSVSRREVGHGHLAERSMQPVLPSEVSFPYTIRVVSETLESNGSSSMAAVCGSSLAIMAAGIPAKAHVAGVAMGLIKEGDKVAILTDILGTEDHSGDMDFKVAGTREGITAIQMDIKCRGLTPQLMKAALDKALDARCRIIATMEQAIPASRKDISPFAPLIVQIKIDKDKIRDIIGPGGKIVRSIQEQTGASINIEDDGTVQVVGNNRAEADAALAIIRGITAEPEVGAIYEGTVKTVTDFGAFVEFLPGRDGLVHISELDTKRVARAEDVAKEGDKMRVKLIGFDPRSGKVKLSRKALLIEEQPPQQ